MDTGSQGSDPAQDNDEGKSYQSLKYITTIVNGWGRVIPLFQGGNPDEFLLKDGSFFCSRNEFIKSYPKDAEKLSLHNSAPPEKVTHNKEPDISVLSATRGAGYHEVYGKNCTPYPEISAQGTPDKPHTLNTINNYNFTNLIVLAQKDLKFISLFNEFCIDDLPRYLKNTLYWIIKNAAQYNLSLEETADSLRIANDKGKQGKMSYLIGIMRNKAGNKALGIRILTKPINVQVSEYFKYRFKHCLEHLRSYSFDWENNEFRYSLKNTESRSSLKDYFRFVVEDIRRAVGVSLSAVESDVPA
ncbi:MAG: hypothetical protein SVZ03_11520 [Spirochaetota bacterium]|nr:hypothetical protein [Spirochaetota bacterium]